MQRICPGSDVIKVLFLIRSLGVGGAESQLVELVRALDKSAFDVTVATFYPGGGLQAEVLKTPGVRLVSLEKRGRWDLVPFFVRLLRRMRSAGTDVICGYMGANEVALLAARLAGAKVAWGLRSSYVDFSQYDWLTRLLYKVGAWLSSLADLIIVNSWSGREHHVAHGYCPRRMVVVPNGVDTERFRFDPDGRVRVRAEWGIGEGEPLVGLVARVDPMKDYPTFLRAAGALARLRPDIRFVCVGEGEPDRRAELARLAESLEITSRLVWAGGRRDMPAVYSALDVLALSSIGEGCPNVVLEAMACGRICVVTDVGDARRIVGDLGIVVPPRRPDLMAEGLLQALTRHAADGLAECRRQRIVEEYGLERLARATAEHLKGLL